MKIVILGNGYIGGHIFAAMRTLHKTIVVARKEVNYHNCQTLKKFLNDVKPDLLIGAFGFTGIPHIDQAEVMKEECVKLNIQVPMMVNTLCANDSLPFVHISSGCIFNGYQKAWSDADCPNFGLYDEASFYSKSKHAFEIASQHLPGSIIRIRMPFSAINSRRNYLVKLALYPNLINQLNSRTCVEDLCSVLLAMIDDGALLNHDTRSVFHVVNPNPLTTSQVVDIMKKTSCKIAFERFVLEDELGLCAPRSNCVLKPSMHQAILKMPDEAYSIEKYAKGALSCGDEV